MMICTWILCAGLLLPYATSEDVLKFAHIMYRHGDRTPYYVFPTDVNNGPSTWYQGLGELIPAGMRRHYQLGMWFRQRYAAFLNNTFDQAQIYVRSTDYNRTIMSAMSNLAGLYPPKGVQNWNSNINWQPIPVHAKDKSIDNMLWMGKSCPKVNELYDTVVAKNAKVMQLQQQYAPFLHFLTNKTGTPMRGIEDFSKIFDAISKEYWTRKERMMPWINDSIAEQVLHLFDLKVHYYYYEDDIIKRLRGGPALGDIVQRMDQKRQNTLDHRRKIYFYSAHDSTVLASLKAMNIEVETRIPYTCAVMVELYQSTNTGQWAVRTFMKNDTGENDTGIVMPHELQVDGCPLASPCPLDQFIKRSQPFIPVDWDAECKIGTNASHRATASIGSILLMVLTACLHWTL